MLKSQKICSDRFGNITWGGGGGGGLKIKDEKIPQELAGSEPQAYPKH